MLCGIYEENQAAFGDCAGTNEWSAADATTHGGKSSVQLCTFGILYLIPIGIALAFYVLLTAYISLFDDSLSIDRLMTMQRDFESASEFFREKLKLKEWKVFLVLFAVYLLSCILLTRRHQGNKKVVAPDGADVWLRFRVALATKLHWVVDFYSKYSGPVATGLATLASFTFFGLQLGESSKDIQLQINTIDKEYAQVAKRTETEFSERVATTLYTNIRDSFSPSYRDALALPEQIDNLVATVQGRADRAKSDYRVNVPEIEKMLQDEDARIKKVNELSSDLTIRGESRQSAPGTTTYSQVKAAEKALDAHPGGEGIEVVNEGRKKVVLHIEKIISEQLVKLTKPLVEAVPTLEPLLQSFVEAMDKTLQGRIEKAYDRAVEAAMRSPNDLARVIEREAASLVSEVDIKSLVEHAEPRAEQQSTKLRQTLSTLEESKSQIDHAIKNKKLACGCW